MLTIDDVRRIALSFPEVFEKTSGYNGAPTWRTKRGLIIWERLPSKKDLAQMEELGTPWPDEPVGSLHVTDLETKESLLADSPEVFFTIPHLDGYPAVLFTLRAMDEEHLRELIAEAWLTRVAKRTAKAWLEEQGLSGEPGQSLS